MLHHRETDTVLAGKMLHPSHREDRTARERFAGEARILRELDHPNLVAVVGLEQIDGADVLVMEYIDGPSLATVIARDAPLDQATLVDLGRQIAAGLAAAHHGGLIHRDLKPANVLLTRDGVAKIVDFGLARATSFEGVEPGAFAIVGTPDYMAPESLDPLAVDPRSDIYSLGCILFEMATGHTPYRGATAFALIEAHRSSPIPEVEPRRDLSPALVDLIRWMLGKSPADRPQSATVVERELARCATVGGALVSVSGDAALQRDRDALSGGSCASCGEPLVAGVPVCFGCGLEQPRLEPGQYSVFVVGPGPVAAKIDNRLRQALLDWLRANPTLGLDPAPLAQRVPRLPFVLATGISEASAMRLVASVERLGFACEIHRGGRFAPAAVRRKAWKLGGRVMAIVAGSSVAVFNAAGPLLLPVGGVALAGALVSGWVMAGRRVAVQRRSGFALPPALTERLDRVAGVVPAIAQRRHRESLRAVVQRVLSLHQLAEARLRDRCEDELAQMLDLAVVAASRVDQLETELAGVDLRDSRDEVRQKLRDRDYWAARLLDAAAALDGLRAGLIGAGDGAGRVEDETLDELRRQVEALEEVRAL